ncbi:anti-sigma factor [Paenibacillus sp. FJAT-26967]|uniref:anti-sigma factor family protein n=1 Tax=Paenibacillus sp. FJAT-26967 TaxID=1729690 RepID=UPI00083967A4|nr:zf-HC2 domain-containing protein [Paenibacillus sp. FJAT-26967]
MNCKEVKELMQRDLDGDLNDLERQRLTQHTQQCPECSAMLQRLRMLSRELENLPKVRPSFSIVDSILPQLEQLDQELKKGGREEAAGLSHIHDRSPRSPQPLPWKRRITAAVSWKTVSGVVAASFVLGFFAFNTQGPVRSDAEGLLNPFGVSEKSSEIGTSPLPDASSTAVSDQNSDKNKAAQSNTDTPAQTAAGSVKESPVPADNGVKAPDSRSSDKDADQSAGTPGSTSSDTKAANEASPGGSVTTPPPSSAVTPTPPATHDNGDKGISKNTGSQTTPAPTTGSTPVVGEADGGGQIATKEPDTDKGTPLTAQQNAGLSPDKKLTAAFDEGRLTILTAGGAPVYVSDKQWKETDAVKIVGWKGNDELTYQVTSGDQQQTFIVSLKTKQERTQ